MAFLKATEAVGLYVDYKQTRGAKRLACISTAFGLFQKVGDKVYREAMQSIVDAWKGDRTPSGRRRCRAWWSS